MKKLIIAAGTGFLGKVLVNHFANNCEEIVILTRGTSKTTHHVRYVYWDAITLSGWEAALENASVLINLAGKSVDCRYTTKNKKEILSSRVDRTKILNEAVLLCKNPPKQWLNSSTSTIYRFSLDKQMTEKNGEIGNDFSMNVAKAWEKTFFETKTPRTLKTALQTSIVLGTNGGSFLSLKRLTQCGLAGKQKNGNQLISWMHEKDFARAVAFIIEKELIDVVNIVSPQPISNANFMSKLQKKLQIPIVISTPEILLKFGAKIMGTEPELVLKSRNVIPDKLINSGFELEFNTLEETLKNVAQ
jgi:uncharacterized protein (TIGR01777 family)